MFLYWFSEDVPRPSRILRGSWEMQITGSEKVLGSLDSKSLNSRASPGEWNHLRRARF